ncbi:MAG: response regulator [Elusimicrobiota bacterium]
MERIPDHSRRRIKILLVEDDPAVREATAELLRRAGYTVRTRADGESARKAVLKNKFNLVLCDYELPGLNGLEFAAHLRSVAPETPLVMVSGVAPVEATLAAVSSGVAGFLSKPYETGNLLWMIERALRSGTERLIPAPPAPPPTEDGRNFPAEPA